MERITGYRTLQTPDDPLLWRVPLRTFAMREAQEGEASPRYADGIALTYGTKIEGYDEIVTPGAFDDEIVQMLRGHSGASNWIANTILTNEGGDYRFEAEFTPGSQAADDAKAEIAFFLSKGHEVDVSLGFRVTEYRMADELTAEERAMGVFGAIDKGEAKELSLVVDGAAPGAMVDRLLTLPVDALNRMIAGEDRSTYTNEEPANAVDQNGRERATLSAARARRIMAQRQRNRMGARL